MYLCSKHSTTPGAEKICASAELERENDSPSHPRKDYTNKLGNDFSGRLGYHSFPLPSFLRAIADAPLLMKLLRHGEDRYTPPVVRGAPFDFLSYFFFGFVPHPTLP